MTYTNAIGNMINQGQTNIPVGITTYNGGAANAQNAANLINQASGGKGTVLQSTHPLDPVPGLFGNNPDTQQNGSLNPFNPKKWLDSHGSYSGFVPPTSLPNGDENPFRDTTDSAWGSGQYSIPKVVIPEKK